ncbi:MAG: hypothetical protein ACM3ZV_12905 [Bacillota bacterium]
MPRLGRFVASALVSLSLVGSSTAAIAQTAPMPIGGDSWLTLSMLTAATQATSSSTVAASTAAVAAQPDSTIPPGTQVCPDGAVIPATATCGGPGYTGPSTPPVAVLAIWALVLGTMVYIVTKNNHSHPVPNSPA